MSKIKAKVFSLNPKTKPFIKLLLFLSLIVILIVFYFSFKFQLNKNDLQNKGLDYILSQYKRALSLHSRSDDNIIDTDFDSIEDTINRNSGLNSGHNEDKDIVIIYNRVPKTGSTSLMGMAYDLCSKNGFNVLHLNTSKNSHVMSLKDQMLFVANVSHWRARHPALIHGHIAYLDFGKMGSNMKPIYINLIRKPLDRLVSYYYFLRNGDNFRPSVVRRRQGDKRSFDECIQKGEHDCNAENMWLQIPFFCGHVFECWVPGSEWALSEAKRNLVDKYLIVGLTEQMEDFIAILDSVLPQFFSGALNLYKSGTKSHLRKTYNKVKPMTETVAKIQESKVWQMENDFYDFASKQFNFVKQKTFNTIDGQLVDKSQQFFFEKIRPKR